MKKCIKWVPVNHNTRYDSESNSQQRAFENLGCGPVNHNTRYDSESNSQRAPVNFVGICPVNHNTRYDSESNSQRQTLVYAHGQTCES